MVVYTAFSQNVSTLYKTTLCSKSTVFLAVTTFWAFFLPLLIAYRSQGFWIKSMSFREQPMVHFKHEHFLYMETSQEQNPMVCSTIRKQSETLESLNHCTSVKFHEEDYNGDGKFDRLLMEFEVETTEPLAVHSVYLLLAFDFILQHQCLLEMEALVVIQSSSSLPAKQLTVLGDLQLVQRALLGCRGRDLRYNQSSFNDPHVNVEQLVREHLLQNVSTRLGNSHMQWLRGESTKFTLQLEILYPEVIVHYRPGFWPIMKWAWVQYLAVLVIFLALHRSVKGYVFLNHLLPTVPERPWKKFNMK